MANRSSFRVGLLAAIVTILPACVPVIDPVDANGYDKRGEAKVDKNDFTGAIADFNHAIALNPQLADAYEGRGYAEYSLFDMKSAMADENRALTLDPTCYQAYFSRAGIHDALGDIDAGIADYHRALQEPGYGEPYYPLAVDEMAQGHLPHALDDFVRYLRSSSSSDESDYARMMMWIILRQQNKASDADLELSSSLDKKLDPQNNWTAGPDDWETKDASFLLGRLNETDYLAAATASDPLTDRGQHCEAWYYSGMKRLLAGDKAGAIDHFKKSVATNRIDYVELLLARSELQTLGAQK